MSNGTTDLSSQSAGNPTEVSPTGENDTVQTTPESADSPRPDDILTQLEAARAELDRAKQDYSASTRESQRLYQENMYLRQQTAQPQPQPPQQLPRESTFDERELYTTFTDGVLERDPSKMDKVFQHIEERAEKRIMGKMTAAQQYNARIQSSMSYVSQHLKDPNSPLAKRAMEHYQQMSTDSSYAYIQPDAIQFGNLTINPHLLREAVTEARAELGSAIKGAASAVSDATYTTTEASRPSPPESASKFSPSKHLSPSERAYVDKMRERDSTYTYDRYWKYLDPSLKEARLKTGRPITKRDISA